mmetsp:Transcript_84596/g.152571  ORF Transcript_84596/g.152571 Transcript_84596/m.152571 type:complete len:119 (-) Transcript_84596:200-556(-)
MNLHHEKKIVFRTTARKAYFPKLLTCPVRLCNGLLSLAKVPVPNAQVVVREEPSEWPWLWSIQSILQAPKRQAGSSQTLLCLSVSWSQAGSLTIFANCQSLLGDRLSDSLASQSGTAC